MTLKKPIPIPGKPKGQPHRTGPPTGAGSGSQPTAHPNDSGETGRSLIERLLEPYVIDKYPNGEWRLRCPFHWDVEGDASYNIRTHKFICFASGEKSARLVFQTLSERELGKYVPPWLNEPQRGGNRSSPQSSGPTGPPSVGVIAGWHKRLLRNPEALAYLTGRLLTLETIRRFELGWNPEFRFYSIPIYDNTGQLYSFMKYRPNGNPKMRYRKGDHATLYPWAILRTVRRGDLLVVCEGHWDAMLLNQHGVKAVTGGSATIWKTDWSVVIRRLGARVVVIYDCDRSGREGRRKPLAGIPGARAVDLAPSRNDGYDVTDYLCTHSIESLLGVIERA